MSKLSLLRFLLLFLVILSHGLVKAQKEGTPDETFGENSIVYTEKGGYWGASGYLGIQSDGKIILLGAIDTGDSINGTLSKTIVYRYSTDGVLDSTFGENGSFAFLEPALFNDQVVDVEILDNDDFFVLVQSEDMTWPWAGPAASYTSILKFQADGFPDISFGSDGRLDLNLASGNDFPRAFEFYKDRLIIVGMGDTLVFGPGSKGYLATYSTALFENGETDMSYGSGGVSTVQVTPDRDIVSGMAIHKDRKFVVVGTYQDSFGGFAGYAMQFLPTGELDLDFGTNGLVLLTELPNTVYTWFQDVVIQGSNIVIAGYTGVKESYFAPSTLLVRYFPNGSLDPSFGLNGVQTDTFNNDNKITQVEIGKNGEIYIGGQLHYIQDLNNFHDEVFISKYGSNGNLINSYGANGGFYGLSSSVIYVNDMKVQPDGKLLISGIENAYDPPNSRLFIQRVNGNPTTAIQNQLPSTPAPRVFPNTVHPGESIHLVFPDKTLGMAYVQLCNSSGQSVFQREFEYEEEIELSLPSLPCGQYLLRIISGKSSHVEKLIIVN